LGPRLATGNRLEDIGAALNTLRATWDERGEALVETGAAFLPGEPIRVFIRERGRNYDLDDRGRAVALAGTSNGWLSVARCFVAEEGFNVNRAGVVFVPAFEGRDLASLALRLADTSHAVFTELVDLTSKADPQRRAALS
jgi:hypothetical protein